MELYHVKIYTGHPVKQNENIAAISFVGIKIKGKRIITYQRTIILLSHNSIKRYWFRKGVNSQVHKMRNIVINLCELKASKAIFACQGVQAFYYEFKIL